MQTVSQLHHDDADILGHGQEQLAVIFQLNFFLGLVLNAPKFRDTIHNHGHFFTEHLRNLLFGINGIFHHIMQERRADGHIIYMQFREDFRHVQGMNDVFLPRHTHLSLMSTGSQVIGFLNQSYVCPRLIGLYRLKYGFYGHWCFIFVIHNATSPSLAVPPIPIGRRTF